MLTVDAKRLLHAVRVVRLADNRSTQTSMVLRGDGLTLALDAVVGDMHVRQKLSTIGDGLPMTTVSCQELHEALTGETVPSVTLQRNGDRLVVGLGQTQVDIGACDGGDVVMSPESKHRQTLGMIDARQLAKALRTVLYARSLDDGGAPKTGVFMESSGEGLRLVATDGHRLACMTMEQPRSTGLDAIMPGAFCETLLRLAKDGHATFDMTGKHKTGILATGSDWSILAPMVSGTFPRYRNVIPNQMAFGLMIQRKAMLEQLTSLKPQLEPVNKLILLKRHRAGLLMEAGAKRIVFEQADVSRMTTFQCNAGYLRDGLDACRGEWVTLETTQTFLRHHGPAMIRDGQALHLLMPIRPALDETDELCPFCGKRFSPEADRNDRLPWKHVACSRECGRLLERGGLKSSGNRISSRSPQRLRRSV